MINLKSKIASPIILTITVFNALIDFTCQITNAKTSMFSVKLMTSFQDYVQDVTHLLSLIMVNAQNDFSFNLFSSAIFILYKSMSKSNL